VIERHSLLSLEAYARERPSFRSKVIEHKKQRTVALGEHVTLLFEDELLVRYQIQEMLRIERIFEEEGIRHELETYGPLVPDGANWKATMFVEFPDVEERRRMLEQLKGIERSTWVQVDGLERIYAIADEDLERFVADREALFVAPVDAVLRGFPSRGVGLPPQGPGVPLGIEGNRHAGGRLGSARREAPGRTPGAPDALRVLRPDAPEVRPVRSQQPPVG
jgi:hypothetical protein